MARTISSNNIDLSAALTSSSSGNITTQTGFGGFGGAAGGAGATWTVGGSAYTNLTNEEKKQLDSLKKDRELWIKQEKIKSFQKLPAHLRQAVVDEACITECIKDMHSIYTSKFDRNDEISKLESKDGLYLAMDSVYNIRYSRQDVYGAIIDNFTTDELMEAHAAITLEENLGDSDGL